MLLVPYFIGLEEIMTTNSVLLFKKIKLILHFCSVTFYNCFYIIEITVILRTIHFIERNGSGVELRTLDYENPGSNPVLRC